MADRLAWRESATASGKMTGTAPGTLFAKYPTPPPCFLSLSLSLSLSACVHVIYELCAILSVILNFQGFVSLQMVVLRI
jgi:hypothetical protein